jgi:putative DNA primase/helicase
VARDLREVIHQMLEHGIAMPPGTDLDKAFSKVLRFRPEGDKRIKKSAWVRLYEYRSDVGKVYITGAYGNRHETFKVEATGTDWSPAERAAWLEARKAAEKAAAIERTKDHETAATKARRMWKAGRDLDDRVAPHPYLVRKQVSAFGLRVGFNQRLLVPLRDLRGELHGLQYVSPEGDKLFGTGTRTEGMSHLLGELTGDAPLLAFGEGYATCATVHMATGWPVVCAFDAGNLAPTVAEYRKLYPDLDFVIVADDDRHLLRRLSARLAELGIVCGEDDLRQSMDRDWQIPDGAAVRLKAGWGGDAVGVMRIEGTLTVDGKARALLLENAGQAKAHAAARRFKTRVFTPFFADRAAPHTDWNDLHCSAGLDSVRAQLLAALDAPPEKPRANARAQGDGKQGKGSGGTGGQGGGTGPVDDDGVPFADRYTLIYGTTTVWDSTQRDILKLEALKAAFGAKRVDWWLGMPTRRMVPQRCVVFDPTGKAQLPDFVNLFDRLPLTPTKAPDKCARILEHLYNLCQENELLAHWVTAWLAYPLQNPGAKMRTALVFYGRAEGTGKSKLGEVMRRIYGRYCTSVGQAELQRDFNEWLSARLLVLCEEVVSRQDRSHHQGMLQALITQTTVQINQKNMPIREEANHANFVFFSNQQVPLVINPRDRRYTVIKVEHVYPPEYFAAIDAELDNGGAEAFLQYLLDYDLQGFDAYTRPVENRDRLHLITLGMSPDQRFLEFWRSGYAGVPFCCCPSSDLYLAFKAWCRVSGERFVPTLTAFGRTVAEELERLGAPPKRTVRFSGYSEKSVSTGDWSTETQRQAVVLFVPANIEVMEARADTDARPEVADPLPDCTHPEYFVPKIKRFQMRLNELLDSARRHF